MIAPLAEIAQLSVAERIQLVEDIWDSVAVRPEDVPLTGAQVQELDRRLDDYQRNPQAEAEWQDVRQRIQGQG